MTPPIILLTDFGIQDGFIGVMKGVIASIAPQSPVIDLTHHIPPQDVEAAKFVLWNSYKHFPQGSIFCCVVDPGVGSKRDIIALQTADYYFIAPDNGLLDYVLAELKIKQLLKVENPALMRSAISQTFHGRDIFAPTAAHLAAGFLYTQVGPLHSYRLPDSPFIEVKEAGVYEGKIIYFDHFGNAISNIKVSGLAFPVSGAEISFELASQHIVGLSSSYASHHIGELLALEGSHGLIEFAVRNGNARRQFNLSYGQAVHVTWKS